MTVLMGHSPHDIVDTMNQMVVVMFWLFGCLLTLGHALEELGQIPAPSYVVDHPSQIQKHGLGFQKRAT